MGKYTENGAASGPGASFLSGKNKLSIIMLYTLCQVIFGAIIRKGCQAEGEW
jgi:hypothetical protein